jgi:Flp pilus assembly pilin Flp
MARMFTAVGRMLARDKGQDLLEYTLLAALIAVFAIVGVSALGDTIYTVFWKNIGQAI